MSCEVFEYRIIYKTNFYNDNYHKIATKEDNICIKLCRKLTLDYFYCPSIFESFEILSKTFTI